MSEHTPTPWIVAKFQMHILPENGSGAICKFESIHGMYANYEANAAFIVKAANHFDALVKALNDIMQRANESSSGEMGLLDTIHAMNGIAREVLASVKERA